jgi:hypothetical protein
MNDFTKEELNIIDKTLLAEINRKFTSSLKNLRDKIQSMIDDYCEHEKDVWPLYTSTGDLPVAGFCYECNQCVGYKND